MTMELNRDNEMPDELMQVSEKVAMSLNGVQLDLALSAALTVSANIIRQIPPAHQPETILGMAELAEAMMEHVAMATPQNTITH